MGLALERTQALRAAAQAREQAQAQQVRNALLAAIAHDHRTPLATILGAASSLVEQDARLSREQRQRLAASIVEEADRLARLTDNTLQLARLDAPGLALALDWESAEELVGTAVARVRRHDPQRRLRSRVEPDLPLLRCDAVLMVQMLINLLDNALKYGAPDAPVELLVRRDRRRADVRGARPRAGRAAGAARAHLRGLSARRARTTPRTAAPASAWRCAAPSRACTAAA